MKKTITLLAIAALITSASFAQFSARDNNYGNGKSRDVVVIDNGNRGDYGKRRGGYYFTARERDMQIRAIHNDYNRRIESVKGRPFMGRSKKYQIISSLQYQRDAEIRCVIDKFNDRRNRFDGRDRRHDDNDRRNNW